jgi:protocadherin Fat 4
VVSGATAKLVLNVNTGAISLAGELDRETVTQYVLNVEATDGTNVATATVTINVLDVNDNAPVFNPTAYRFVFFFKCNV